MSVYEHLLSIYEQSTFHDTRGRIAGTLLKNYHEIKDMSLKEIAIEANVSKGTVSKFCNDITEEGTYEALQTVSKNEMIYLEILKNNEDKMILSEKIKPALSKQDMHELVRYIMSANKIVVLVSRLYQMDVEILMRKFIEQGKLNMKIFNVSYNKEVVKEIQRLKEDDLLLTIEPEYSLYERFMRSTFEMNYMKLIQSCPAHKIAIQKYGEKTDNVLLMNLIDYKNVTSSECVHYLMLGLVKRLDLIK